MFKYCRLVVVIGAFLSVCAWSWALDARSGMVVSVPAGSVVDDDLALAGQSVHVDGSVRGDAFLAGQSVRSIGSVGGTVFAAGSSVNLRGPVGGSVWAAGSDVSLESSPPGNAALAGSSVFVAKTSRIGRDLYASGANVALDGVVGRDLRAWGSTVTISGMVNRDASIQAESVNVTDGAVIKGDLTYTSLRAASIAPGARILGKVTHVTPTVRKPQRGVLGWTLWRIYWILALIALGVALVAVSPARARAAGERTRTSFWWSLLWGLVVLIVTPAAIIIGMLTVIGIPLALVVLASYLIMIAISRIYAGIGLGDWILRRFGVGTPHAMWSMVLGVALIGLLSMTPWVGWFVALLAMLVGLGASVSDCLAWLKDLRARGEA